MPPKNMAMTQQLQNLEIFPRCGIVVAKELAVFLLKVTFVLLSNCKIHSSLPSESSCNHNCEFCVDYYLATSYTVLQRTLLLMMNDTLHFHCAGVLFCTIKLCSPISLEDIILFFLAGVRISAHPHEILNPSSGVCVKQTSVYAVF